MLAAVQCCPKPISPRQGQDAVQHAARCAAHTLLLNTHDISLYISLFRPRRPSIALPCLALRCTVLTQTICPNRFTTMQQTDGQPRRAQQACTRCRQQKVGRSVNEHPFPSLLLNPPKPPNPRTPNFPNLASLLAVVNLNLAEAEFVAQ